MISMKIRSERLAEVRAKVARSVDAVDNTLGSPFEKVVGKKASQIKLSESVSNLEKKISLKIYDR